MKILIVSQYFWPENFRINDLAVALKNKGHEVTVLTGLPNYPEGDFFGGYGIFRRSSDEYNGIRIVRVPLISRGKSKGLRLALNYLSFAFFASLFGPFYCKDRYDAIFVFEPSPITVGLPAIVLKKIRKAPIFFWMLDLWPESLQATGAVSSPFVLGIVRRLVLFIYANCDRILVSSKGFSEQVASLGYPAGNICYFPNWAEDIYWRRPAESPPPAINNVPEGFNVVFAGNIGAAQSFPTILKAAEILREVPDVHWVIIGDGRMAGWVQEEIKKRNLGNSFYMLGRHAPEDVARIFSRSSALLVALGPDPAFALTVPGKIQSYLACGKPVIASLDGEGARLIEESGAGLSCPAGDAEALARAIRSLRNMSGAEREQMGGNGLKFCQDNFSRTSLIDKLEGWIIELAKKYN